MTGLLFSDDRARDLDASQWFTPPDLATRVVDWCGAVMNRAGGLRVLEPSAGRGALLSAILEKRPKARVTAVEIDQRWASELRERFPSTEVVHGDYLTTPAPSELYDIAITNPPYEDGLDGRFLAKALDESERVIAILRTVALHGLARHEQVWRRCHPMTGDVVLRGVALMKRRPQFGGGESSAKSDFCVAKLSRRRENDDGKTVVEWW